MSGLPKGWVEARLGDVFAFVRGLTYAKEDVASERRDDYLPLLRANNIQNSELDLNDLIYLPRGLVKDEQILRDGDIVMATSSGSRTVVGKAARAVGLNGNVTFGAFCGVVRPYYEGGDVYLLQYMRSRAYREYVEAVAIGTNINNFRSSDIQRMGIPFPPLAEQKRIVTKLNALNVKSARARTELARIETLVSRYKEAVLSKAFSGKLIEPILHDAALTVDAVKRERDTILAGHKKRNTKGTAPSPDRKPVKIGQLPKSWCVLSLEELSDPLRLIQYGILKPGPDIDGGVPYVKVMNIKGGFVELGNIRRTTKTIHQNYARSTLKKGDLLLTIRGTVGRVAVTPAELDGGNITQDTVRIATINPVSARYIYWYLQSPTAQEYFGSNKRGVAVQGINVGDVRPMEVPVAPPEEQYEIVSRIESAFAKIDRLSVEAKRALELVGKLEEAILVKAFRGELVPQDGSDEQAHPLLERISAERQAAPKSKLRTIKRETTMPTAKDFLKAKLKDWPADGISFKDLRREFGGSYDDLKEAVFASLSDERSPLKQVFDEKTSTMTIRKRA